MEVFFRTFGGITGDYRDIVYIIYSHIHNLYMYMYCRDCI